MQQLIHHFKSALTLAILITTISTHGMEPQTQDITEIEFEVYGTRVKFEGQEARMLAEKMTERERLFDSAGNYLSVSTVLVGHLAAGLGFNDLFLVSLAIPTLISIPGIWKRIRATRLNTSIEEDIELEAAIQLSRLDQEKLITPQQIELLEPELGIGISDLPRDIHNEIIKMALASSNTLTETIKAINVANALRGVRYDNLKDFTQLMHILAGKFNVLPSVVAKEFNTSTAQTYSDLGCELSMQTRYWDLVQLIKQGADLNFINENYWTPLGNAIMHQDIELVRLLFNSGANLTPHHLTAAVWLENHGEDTEKATAIRQMIEEIIRFIQV